MIGQKATTLCETIKNRKCHQFNSKRHKLKIVKERKARTFCTNQKLSTVILSVLPEGHMIEEAKLQNFANAIKTPRSFSYAQKTHQMKCFSDDNDKI